MPWTVCPPVRLICFLATTRKRMPLSISLFARVLSRLADWRSWPHKLRLTSPLLDGILNVDHRLAIVGHPVRIGDIVPAKKLVVLVEDRTPTSVQFPFRTRRYGFIHATQR